MGFFPRVKKLVAAVVVEESAGDLLGGAIADAFVCCFGMSGEKR